MHLNRLLTYLMSQVLPGFNFCFTYLDDMLTTKIPADSASAEEFRKAITKDTTSGLLMQSVMNGWPESGRDCHPCLLDYWTYREKINTENSLLFKGHRLIIPEKLHSKTLQTFHEGNFGVDKMQLRDKESVFWPKITLDILQTVQSCKVCQTFSRIQQRKILLPHDVPQGPWGKR